MYRLTRISAVPATPLQILIDLAEPGNPDMGMTVGGSYRFEPGETIAVTERAAAVIMGDPGLAAHFVCEPPWLDPSAPIPEPAPMSEPATEMPKRRRAHPAGV